MTASSTSSLSPTEPTIREEIRAIAKLSAPISLAQVALVAMGLVDTAILGRESVDDLAAAGLARSVGFAALSFGLGIAAALEPLAAQAIGARQPNRAWKAQTSAFAAIAIAWPLMVLGSLASTFLLPRFGVEATVVDRARLFLLGQAPGQLLFLAFLVAKTFLQAHGNTSPALVATGAANVVNFIACQLFVRGDDALRSLHLPPIGLPKLGAFGAGCSSSVASLALFGVVWMAARRFRPTDVSDAGPTSHGPVRSRPPANLLGAASRETAGPTSHRPSRDEVGVRQVLAVGLPIGFQMLAEIGVFSMCALHAGEFGARAESAHQIALGLASFTFMGALGVSAGTAVRVGLAVGEGRSPRRIGLVGIGVGAGVQLFGALIFTFFPEFLAARFSQDPAVIRLGGQLLYIAAIFQLFDGMQAVAGGALRGVGDVHAAFLLNVFSHWCVGYPIALALAYGSGDLSRYNPSKYIAILLHTHDGLGVRGLWIGLTAGLVTVALTMSGRFLVLSRRTIARL
jgi:MATE family multidrug resistance protein